MGHGKDEGPGLSSLKALGEPQETPSRKVFGHLNSGLSSFPSRQCR